jgi:hypothetical protein
MFKNCPPSFLIGILAFSSFLLMGQDCFAQTGLCDPDPCQGIPNAIGGTCTEVGGPCTGPSNFFCSCVAGSTWQAATHTCESSQSACDGVVDFPDSNLEQAIRDAIGKPTGDIFADDLLGLTLLLVQGVVISHLSGLECCTALTDLYLPSNQIVDVSPLSGLVNLTQLDLYNNQIVDISPLAGLVNLTWLSLWDNQIVEVSPLSGLVNLTQLDLYENQIVDIGPLAGLVNLTNLYLGYNQIVDVSPLSGLVNLTQLDLYNNQIVDISPLAGLVNLTWLYLCDNQITDLQPLVLNAGIDSGDEVWVNANPLDATSCTVHIPALEGRGVTVYHDCPIECGPPAPVAKTGQTTSYATGDDGDLEKGVASPVPRFTDNGDGTMTDDLTGLTWTQDGGCAGDIAWADALDHCNTLTAGYCGLTDGSIAGDWRLANVKELISLVDYSKMNVVLPNGHPFTNVVHNTRYWSSSTWPGSGYGWNLYMSTGGISYSDKGLTSDRRAWCVRGGQ